MLSSCAICLMRRRLAWQIADQHRLKLQIQFAGLDLGQVEDVVDQGEQVPTAVFNMS